MAHVYRKTYTKPVPIGAEFFTRRGARMVRWTAANGKTKMARVTVPETGPNAGTERLLLESATYTARYKDQDGILREKPTGCRELVNANRVLADILKHVEQAKAGVLTKAELAQADHQKAMLAEHFARYEEHLHGKGVTEQRVRTVRQRFNAIADWAGWTHLADLTGEDLERFLRHQAEDQQMGAGSRNGYREAAVAFANWAKRTKRLPENPFDDVPKADANVDCRRCRRAMSEDELRRLLDAAQRRPLHEALLIRRGKRKGELGAKVSEARRERLTRLGRERAMIYKTLALTGLRRNELASITVGQADLESGRPRLYLHARDEKSRRGSTIPLRSDLADDLRAHIADRLAQKRQEARKVGEAIPTSLEPSEPLLRLPEGMLRVFDRDLAFAGIPKKDSRGWTLDLHALRKTYGTLLSKGGVPLRTAQAAMRHSDPSLTANVYTDPQLLDVAGAHDSLPVLSLDAQATERQRATGTTASATLAPMLAPGSGQKGHSVGSTGRSRQDSPQNRPDPHTGVSAFKCNEKRPLSSPDNGRLESGRQDLNLRPLRPEHSALPS